MKYTLYPKQISALSKWFENDSLYTPASLAGGGLEIEIFGDDSMVGAEPQFKWDGEFLNRDGKFSDDPANDGWVSVEGDLIGWLYNNDGDDQETMVIRAADGTIWLRWIGNDFYATTRWGSILDDGIVAVGDHISFSTSKEEQAGYANPTP